MNPRLDLTLRRLTEAVTARNGGFVNIHDPRLCIGEHCVFHRPSFHSMLLWPKVIRIGPFDSVPGLIERLCPHGVGHPDPDSAAYFERSISDASVHGCDGCCLEPALITIVKAVRWHALSFHPWYWIDKVTRSEMSEGGLRQAPHCCSQGECWAHVDSAWCRCVCRFCRIARQLRPLPTQPSIPSIQED